MPSYSKRRGWKSSVRIWTVPFVAFACLAGLLYEELSFRHRQKAWASAIAVVDESRIHPVAKFAFEYGSKDLYEVEILAAYSANGVAHMDWVPLSTAPKSLAEAQAASLLLKGKRCTVRWDPESPSEKIAEIP